MSNPVSGPDEKDQEQTPNREQQELIDSTEGLYTVDAGPGTGKTFAITRRYANIVDQPGVAPEDVMLVTFTTSAATEMKDRIVAHSDYGMRALADAPIQTFHSRCHDILSEYGYAAPTHLGIDDRITGSTRIIEDDLVEDALFREFLGGFRDRHSEYADVFRALSDPINLLDLVSELAAKGVFPTKEGWYRDGEQHLDGDYEAFKECFDEVNEPRNDGRKQSDLRDDLSRFGRTKTYLPDAPSKSDLRGSRGTKQLDDSVARRVFEENRDELKAFVHDVYYEYLEFALSRNYLNFGFLQLFAFVLLCEDEQVREAASAEYVMVDEFQDTSEIQFKLALLLAATDNFCVVGDWKQSIYAFQYADVENITDFDDRLGEFIDALNSDRKRISFDAAGIQRIELEENYRSTQSVIDFSEHALTAPATSKEDPSEETLGPMPELSSNATVDNSRIEGIVHAEEYEAVLTKIQEIVGNEKYAIEDENGERTTPGYEDIAVLTRTRDWGRDLLAVAEEYDIPLAYDGGVELFRTDPAKVLLAWLRILEDDTERGWAVVLERAGYTLDEIEAMLESEEYPSNVQTFRATLAELESVGAVARRVFERYGMVGVYADVLLDLVQSMHDDSTLTRGALVQFIERGIESGSTHEVHTGAGAESATVQTIHGAKGLEYPIVVMANMNDGKFPPSGGENPVISFEEPVGLRQRKQYAEVDAFPHVYHNWRHDVIRHCLTPDYDEERRLLYVAITRAESHVVFAGGEEPNTLLQELPVDIESYTPTLDAEGDREYEQAQLPFVVSPPDGPTGYSPHSLMDESIFDESPVEGEPDDGGRGMDYGTRVHDFAEAFVVGEDVTVSNADEQNVQTFLEECSGTLYAEEEARLPLTVDDTQVMVSGIIDLLEVRAKDVRIIDYKTDRSRHAQPEYRKQLSIYYHVVSDCYPEREVTTCIYYTHDDDLVSVDPLSEATIRELVRKRQPGHSE